MRVYHDGIPAWNKRNFTTLNARALKEGWIDKGLPFVLLDVREAAEAAGTGFVPGAVSVPGSNFEQALASFPSKELRPPVVVYDAAGNGVAEKAAKMLVAAGYGGPRVLAGGYASWLAEKYPTGSGNPATTVSYAPKPKPGTISPADFEAFAKAIPADAMLIDVRGKEDVEVRGTIREAVHIPCDSMAGRLAEIPKEKDIVLYCNTGVMAEMSYNILKERGYSRVRFLEATVTTDPAGGFTISK